MMPCLFSMDAHARAQELASSVLSSSSPPAIASAISAADSILRKISTDQSRAFFSFAFPAIICRLFGFDDSPSAPTRSASTAWIDQAHRDPDLACRLFNLLSPQGPLFSAISSADRHGLVKYVFPAERLPEWMRYALQSERYSSMLPDLCSLFHDRIKEDPILGTFQLQLNAFEYFMFWFAYYPVCRGDCDNFDHNFAQKSRRRSRLQNWTSSFPVFVSPSRRSDLKNEVSLYLRLLYSYMCAFVPKCGLGSHQPNRCSLLHYSSACDVSVFEQAEFLVNTMIHFWLVDNDFNPLPLNVCRSFGISFQHRSVLAETPPTAGLGEILKLFVNYLNSCLVVSAEGSNQKVLSSVNTSSLRPMLSLERTSGSWNSAMQRPLYRFLMRSFFFCPIGASIKNVSQVLSVWVTYMVPWRTTTEDFVEFKLPEGCKLESSKKELVQGKITGENERRHLHAIYTPLWEGYVASNYLFYNSLVMHFLVFAHKFLHANAEAIVDMVSKVLSILTSSQELMDLLRKVEAAHHSKQSSGLRSVDKYIPSIRQHLKDWEDGLWSGGDLKLFGEGEDGGLKLLQLLVLRAENEMDGAQRRLDGMLDSVKLQTGILFGGAAVGTCGGQALPLPDSIGQTGRGGVGFSPKRPGAWADFEYKGDHMRRPISDDEVAWLARLFIRFSDRVNDSFGLGLGRPGDGRRRVNLRVFSSKKFLFLLLFLYLSTQALRKHYCCWLH